MGGQDRCWTPIDAPIVHVYELVYIHRQSHIYSAGRVEICCVCMQQVLLRKFSMNPLMAHKLAAALQQTDLQVYGVVHSTDKVRGVRLIKPVNQQHIAGSMTVSR